MARRNQIEDIVLAPASRQKLRGVSGSGSSIQFFNFLQLFFSLGSVYVCHLQIGNFVALMDGWIYLVAAFIYLALDRSSQYS